MGGSFALALKRAGLVKRVVGYSKSPSTTERARQMGVIDVEAPSALLAVSGADIAVNVSSRGVAAGEIDTTVAVGRIRGRLGLPLFDGNVGLRGGCQDSETSH